MKINRLLFLILLVISFSIILVLSAEDFGDSEYNIWIECESAKDITEPLEIIEMDGASGGKAIVSTGYHHYHIGRAVYNVDLPKNKYYFWVRAYWPLVCSNSYKMKVNNGELLYIGNTSTLNKWHWIKGPLLELNNNNRIEIWNDEQNSRLDKILLTTNSNYIPSGKDENHTLNFDFESENIKGLKFKNKKNWQLIREEYLTNNRLYLKPVEKDESAFINVSCNNNYIYQLSTKYKEKSDIYVLFDYQNKDNYYGLSIFEKSIKLYKVVDKEENILNQKNLSKELNLNDFYNVMIIKSEGRISVLLDGKTIIDTFDQTFYGGKVGFGSKKGDVCFDNIAYLSDLKPFYNNDYHQINFFYTTKNVPETNQEYLKNLNRSVLHYWLIEGKWEDERNGVECFKGLKNSNNDALILFGHPFWNNYSFKCGIQAPADGKSFGVCFNAQDSSNYYLFRWNHLTKKMELIKKVNSVISTISSSINNIENLQWYRFLVKQKDDSINIYLDDNLIISTKDSTFYYGRIGYWTNSFTGSFFDDIALGKTTTLKNDKEQSVNYIFHNDGDVSYSLAGWTFDNPNVLKHYMGPVVYQNLIYLRKERNENVYMWHKKEISSKFDITWLIRNQDIPMDVDIVYNFQGLENEGVKVVIGANKVKLFKNNKLLATARNTEPRKFIELNCSTSSWKINVNNKLILEQLVNLEDKRYKMNFGFVGKGEANIDIYEIRLKQNN